MKPGNPDLPGCGVSAPACLVTMTLLVPLVLLLRTPRVWGPALMEATASWAGTVLAAEKHPGAFKALFSPLLSNENPRVICERLAAGA